MHVSSSKRQYNYKYSLTRVHVEKHMELCYLNPETNSKALVLCVDSVVTHTAEHTFIQYTLTVTLTLLHTLLHTHCSRLTLFLHVSSTRARFLQRVK